MKPKHFYSLVKFKEQWYKYDNMNKKELFTPIDEPEHLPCNLKKKFTTVLFYVRDADPNEPICVTLTSRDTLNLGLSAVGTDPSPTTKVPKANHNDVWKYLNDYPNNHPGHVICCFDGYFATTFTSIDEPLRKNELYTAHIYNPAEVVQPKDLFLYKIATRVYRRNICHHDSISSVYNYLKQTIPKKDILVVLTDLSLESEKNVVFNPDKDDVIDLVCSDDEEKVKKKEKPKSSSKRKPVQKPKSSAKRKPTQQVSKSIASVSSDSPDNCVPRVFIPKKTSPKKASPKKDLSLASSDTETEIEENIH
jgi:hypothetical protein